MVKQTNKRKCNCIVAFHVGHSQIKRDEATKKRIIETCCGGVVLINYCPICGERVKEKDKYITWQRASRIKDLKARIKNLKNERKQSNFMKSVLECYEKELKELNDTICVEEVA